MVEENETEQHEKPSPAPLEYPQHSDSFEAYFWLGESRRLKTAARIRFEALFPDCPPDSAQYVSKFESFYTKIKRWASKEHWEEWVKRKEIEERHKREAELRERIGSVNRIVRSYQGLVRQMIVSYTEDVKLSAAYQKAVREGNAEDMERLAIYEDKAKIKNARELALLLDFDLRMSEKLELTPDVTSDDHTALSEETAERIDKVMEFIRKRARESHADDEEIK